MKTSLLGNLLSSLIDLIWAGLLWLVCSLPLITVGASSTALYYTVVKCIRHERESVSKCFFHSFRINFRQATIIWSLCLLYVAIGIGDIYAFSLMGGTKGSDIVLSQPAFFPSGTFSPSLAVFFSFPI